jgi:hypothetical protein
MYLKHGFDKERRDLTALFAKLVIQEVKGPSFPSADRMPPPLVHLSTPTTPKPALERLGNYTNDDLQRLLPRRFSKMLPQGNHSEIEEHGLTQESFLADEHGLDEIDTFDFDGDADAPKETVDVFEESTLGGTTTPSDAREFLKSTYNKLLGCLDSLKDDKTNLDVARALKELINDARSKIGAKRKHPLDTWTVNIMIEQQPNSVRRNYASRNC